MKLCTLVLARNLALQCVGGALIILFDYVDNVLAQKSEEELYKTD